MKNKKVLILLGIILLLTIALLIGYAYSLNESQESPVLQTYKTTKPTNSVKENVDSEGIKEFLANSEKKPMPADGQLEGEDRTKVEQQVVKSAKGVVKEIGENKVVIDFDYQGTKWASSVTVNKSTSIYMPAPNASSMGEVVGLSSLKAGDSVIANGEKNIFNQDSFTALSIHKVK